MTHFVEKEKPSLAPGTLGLGPECWQLLTEYKASPSPSCLLPSGGGRSSDGRAVGSGEGGEPGSGRAGAPRGGQVLR